MDKSLITIGKEIAAQDNAITQDPLFVVFQKQRIYHVDEDDEDGFEWRDDDFDLVSHQKATALERKYQWDSDDAEGFRRVNYKEIDMFITACFTRKAAKAYIKANKHNLEKPFIYVTSLWRNEEMKQVRGYLKSLAASDRA